VKLTITRGLPGSGKSTWVKEQIHGSQATRARVGRDYLRLGMHDAALYGHATERQVTVVQHAAVEQLLRSGVDVYVDDTNLRSRYVRTWVELADRVGAEFAVQDFTDVPLGTCIERDKARFATGGHVGEAVIRDMHTRYLAGRTLPLPVPEPAVVAVGRPYVPVPGTPRAVMVDIDGTVALHGDRDPYDTSRYHEDSANEAVVTAVAAMYVAGCRVLFCSGRDATYRGVTERWLRDKILSPYWIGLERLLMRPAGDTRRDDVVKLELFDRHIRDQYDVTCVFDDRDRVVQAWRGIGLTVFQVAEGNF
jgi:predicted kinase